MRNNIAVQLDTAHSVVGNMLAAVRATNKSKTIRNELTKAQKEITASVDMILAHPKSRSFAKTRKALVAINNTVGGLLEGLASQEISVKDFRAVCSNLETKFIPNFVTNLAQDVAKMNGEDLAVEEEPIPVVEAQAPSTKAVSIPLQAVRASLSAGKSLQDQLAGIKAMLKEAEKAQPVVVDSQAPDEDDEAEETEEEKAERLEREREVAEHARQNKEDVSALESLQILRRQRNVLPQRLEKTSLFKIVKLPLVPIFPENFNVTSERNLNRVGIKHTLVQGYAFLNDQMILCVSRTEIEKANLIKEDKNKKEVKGKVAEKKAAETSMQKRADVLRERIVGYSEEMHKIKKKLDAQKTNVTRIETALKASVEELRKISPAEYTRLEFVRLHKLRENAGDMTAAESKKLDLMLKKGHSKEKLKEEAAKEISKLKSKDVKQLSKLKEKIKGLKEELVPVKKLKRKLDSLAQQASGANVELGRQEGELERREEEIKQTKKLLKPKSVAVTPADYALTVLDHINEVSHSNYTLVTPEFKVNIRNADILCFWIMPSAKLNSLLRDAGGKTKVQWSFPWDA